MFFAGWTATVSPALHRNEGRTMVTFQQVALMHRCASTSGEVSHHLSGRVERLVPIHLFSGGEVREEVIQTQITVSSRRRASRSKE